MTRWRPCALWAWALGAMLFLLAPASHANVLCTVGGTIDIEPTDQYYCDSNILPNCSQWLQVDLDRKRAGDLGRAPLPYLKVEVFSQNVLKAVVQTNSIGGWSATVSLPGTSCQGQQLRPEIVFDRVHEDDVGIANPRYRFRITDPAAEFTSRRGTIGTVTFGTGSTFSVDVHFNWSATPSPESRTANVYYTLSQAIHEIRTWSANVDFGFQSTDFGAGGVLRFLYGPTWDNGGLAQWGPWRVFLGWGVYPLGFISRHEFGHMVHKQIHHRNQTTPSCYSYNFNTCAGAPAPAPAAVGRECEYGHIAMHEGFASFVAARSVASRTANDVFLCKCASATNFSICSQAATQANTPGDWILQCPGAQPNDVIGFVGIGDTFSNSPATCAKLRADGRCNCTGSPCTSPANYISTSGWRNDSQVTRFLWDMLDTSNDGGQDDTHLGTVEMIEALEGMPCSASQWGVNGTCNEFDRCSGSGCGSCSPASDCGIPGSGSGTRDSYNVWDIANLLPGDQGAERTLNCVQGATD